MAYLSNNIIKVELMKVKDNDQSFKSPHKHLSLVKLQMLDCFQHLKAIYNLNKLESLYNLHQSRVIHPTLVHSPILLSVNDLYHFQLQVGKEEVNKKKFVAQSDRLEQSSFNFSKQFLSLTEVENSHLLSNFFVLYKFFPLSS